jgi:hypothetical protein
VDDVQDLARRTGEEVADWRDTLNGHTKTINAIRDDQVDQGKKLARVEKEMHAGFAEMNENFAKVDENFAKVQKKFDLLHQGQDRITKLLTRHLDAPDEETRAGDTDE